MKTVVAVIVYDRFDNIKEWVRCWNMCDTRGAQLVIVHNYASEADIESYSMFLAEAGISYVSRVNVGFDIGAFQDVCAGRLEAFPEWDHLLWCTDDNLPMRKDFVLQYNECMKRDVGVAAMHLSEQVKLHIRTTGFMITKACAEGLKFDVDPVITKAQCYDFEHRSAKNTFLQQVNRMGLKAVQVTKAITQACFWDTGNQRTISRKTEHYQLFPLNIQSPKKVVIICPVFNSYPEIIGSMMNQTHENWELWLVHDGPSKLDIQSIVDATGDKRIKYTELKVHRGGWGHYIRQDYLNVLKSEPGVDFVVITNADNHHVPTYLEYMIAGFADEKIVATYCDKMIHSYIAWEIIHCRPKQGYMDCAGVMVRRDVACSVGWNDVDSHSADWLYFQDIINKYGVESFNAVKGCLFSHN